MKVLIKRPLSFNLTGYDLEPAQLEPGEHEIQAPHEVRIAAWLQANPEYGEVFEGEEAAEGDEPDDDEGLSALTVAQLHELAEERGVEVHSRATKAELVAAIEGSA